MLAKIISGGQTGVDRAALDVAIELGIPAGGWCPKGRRAEYEPIPEKYPLHETPTEAYPERTEWNVRDSDATLILTHGPADGGTRLTWNLAKKYGRPCLKVNLKIPVFPALVHAWIGENGIRTLNVAGPRESSTPGIHELAVAFLRQVFTN